MIVPKGSQAFALRLYAVQAVGIIVISIVGIVLIVSVLAGI